MNILGICDGQDCGASLVKDGKIIAAVNEERLSRIKLHEGYYNGFPDRSIRFVLSYIGPDDIDFIAVSSYVDPPLPLRIYSLIAKPKGRSAPTTLINTKQKEISWVIKGWGYDYFCKKKYNSVAGFFSILAYKPFLSHYLKKFGLN